MDFKHIQWDSVPAEQLSPVLERRFFSTVQFTVARFLLKKGCVVPLHQHVNEQLAFVLQGSLRFALDPEGSNPREVILHSGDSLWIPANLPHRAEALEDTIDLDVFSPPRQDWQKQNDSYLR